MITYHVLKQKISKLKQLISIIESAGGQAMTLHRTVRVLENSVRDFPKAKDDDKLDKEVAEESRQAHAVLQRFMQNLSMACYHFAQRGKRDEFIACEMKLTRSVRIWQTENVGFSLIPDEAPMPEAQKSKPSVKGILKKKTAKV